MAIQTSKDILSVTDALMLAKNALESCTVKILGEVSEVSNKPGYKAVYFSIKDQKSSMPCMMWNNRYRDSGIDLRVGMLVELSGRFSLYAAKGRMNFDVFSIALAGEGNLRLQVANLAKKLQAEGLMDQSKKRPIPAYCTEIGLVTSPRGAAVHDVMRTLRRRFPLAHVLLAGVAVEGQHAPEGLIDAISCVCNAGAQVVLLVRGGGSFEDLMPFNDEKLARAIASCSVPVVTGIGHEPDTSIADMVADLRASTPTAAAESVSPSQEMLSEMIARRFEQLNSSVRSSLNGAKESLYRYSSKPVFTHSQDLLAQEALHLDDISNRLSRALPTMVFNQGVSLLHMKARLAAKLPHSLQTYNLQMKPQKEALQRASATMFASYEHKIALQASKLEDLSPLCVLARGYGIVQSSKGNIIQSTCNISSGDDIFVQMQDGCVKCLVEKVIPKSQNNAIDTILHQDDIEANRKETLW